MRRQLLGVVLGVGLIGFGVSLQPVHSNVKQFVPNKSRMKNYVNSPSPAEFRQHLRNLMSPQEKRLYNHIRRIATAAYGSLQKKIEKIMRLSESKKLSHMNKSIVLNAAVILANNGLAGEQREKTLRQLNEKTPQARWFLNPHPNPNLIKLSRLQYSMLMAEEDL